MVCYKQQVVQIVIVKCSIPKVNDVHDANMLGAEKKMANVVTIM